MRNLILWWLMKGFPFSSADKLGASFRNDENGKEAKELRHKILLVVFK